MKKIHSLLLALVLLAALCTPALAADADAAQTFWNGDWYGWWYAHDGSGDYEAMEGNWWDCCARISVDGAGEGAIAFWDEDYSANELMAEVQIRVKTGGSYGETGVAVSESGSMAADSIEEGAWTIDPSLSPYEDMLVIEGSYSDDNGSFEYGIFLRPWGCLWDDVAADSPDDLPYYYNDWYLPALEADAAMPDVIGAAWTAGTALPDDAPAEKAEATPVEKPEAAPAEKPAEEAKTSPATEPLLDPVTDEAGLLTATEAAALTRRAEELTSAYGCGVYLVVVNDYNDYSYSGSVEGCAEDLFSDYSLGLGKTGECVLLLLSMAERDYDILAHGNFCNTAFTDYGKRELADEFLSDFGDGEWYEGFSDYLEECGRMMALAKEGKPIDVGSDPADTGTVMLVSIGVGVLVSLLVCLLLRRQMKSVRPKTEANAYIPEGGTSITYREDTYTHSTESRRKIEKSSGGGGGGTSVNSGGFSHSSGKF